MSSFYSHNDRDTRPPIRPGPFPMREERNIVYTSDSFPKDEPPKPKTGNGYINSTFTLVSKFAYLIGVHKRFFESEYEPPKMEWYEKLGADPAARIIRNLCILRSDFFRSYKQISAAVRFDMKNISTLPEYISSESLHQLERDGIFLSPVKPKGSPIDCIIQINQHISNRINNCINLFPEWIKWEYIRSLFLMPSGLKDQGVKDALTEYKYNSKNYPYQVYINWPAVGKGNILYNDKKFVTLLYEVNEDVFSDYSKVSDAGALTKASIYEFLEQSERVAVMVDCENTDPYMLYAVLNNLDQEALLSKIQKIILYNDIHAASAWTILDKFTEIPVEHNMIERIKADKSLVDIHLTTGTCREFYMNHIDSFILVSSDSDYWGLISSMPEVRFLVMVESSCCGPDIKNALINAGITYCYINDFCTGNSNEIKIAAVLSEVRRYLDNAFHINVQDMLKEAYRATRAEMSTTEKNNLYEKYIKPMKIVIAADGEATIKLGE